MAINQRTRRSDQEWFNIISECRQSGLSDKNWCEIHDIPISSFHTAAKRLRNKAYAVPDHSVNDINTLDFTAKQEIVQVSIEQDSVKESIVVPVNESGKMYIDNSHTMEITIGNAAFKFTNSVNPDLMKIVLQTIGGAYAG